MNIFTEYQLNSKSIAYWVMILMIDIKLNIFVFFSVLRKKTIAQFLQVILAHSFFLYIKQVRDSFIEMLQEFEFTGQQRVET